MPTENHAQIRYRKDIDGLRAIAVLLVLADHFKLRFPGGYIGVDVFFVISGYLISAIIIRDVHRGTFSFADFYERRIRRIFPAMLVMLACVTLMTLRYSLPVEAVDFAKSLVAALLSCSNMYFWTKAGYFATDNKPLLHTWSLGVEEQFYIFFPILLVLLLKMSRRHTREVILLLTGASFILASITVFHHPNAAFFLAPLRAWELLIGTCISQHYYPQLRGAASRHIAGVAGLCLILVPSVTYEQWTIFPGLTAVPPCLGAALIIAAGEYASNFAGRILSRQPFVFIGQISYSLYLWHWPLGVFQRYDDMVLHGGFYGARVKLTMIALSLLAGTLSWAFVERPFRFGKSRPGRRSLFAITGAAFAALLVFSVVCIGREGFQASVSPRTLALQRYINFVSAPYYREGTCFTEAHSGQHFSPDNCVIPHTNRPTLLVFGSSQAAHLWWGLSRVYPDREVLEAASSGCTPYLPSQLRNPSEDCLALSKYMYETYFPSHHVDTVLLSGVSGPEDIARLAASVDWLHARGFRVILLGPSLQLAVPMGHAVAAASRRGIPVSSLQNRWVSHEAEDRQMQELAATKLHVPYISVYSLLCRPNCPIMVTPDAPLLFDTGHLTPEGSEYVATALRQNNLLP